MAKFVAKKPEEKEVIFLRIPSDILKEVDMKSALVGISRNGLINQMIIFSLENMEEPSE